MKQNSLDRILLVDDDKVTNLLHKRQIARRALAQKVDVVTDGRAALEYFADRCDDGAELPDLVMLDINMPRMNGFEFLEEYDRLSIPTEHVPCIVMVSTSTLRQDRARAQENRHVAEYATKPLSDTDIERIVRLCQEHSG